MFTLTDMREVIERFWDKVGGEGPNNCWEWNGARSKNGYGRFWINGAGVHYAHRISYIMCSGPIPDGGLVLHRCDNPPCVNPEHLYLGNHSENALDVGKHKRESLLVLLTTTNLRR